MTEEKEDTTMGKRRERRKRGRGIWQHERLKKKKRDASLPQNTFDSRRALYHATTARVQRNDAKRERERERDVVVVVWLHGRKTKRRRRL